MLIYIHSVRYNKQKMIGDIIMREKTACFTGHREIPKKDMRKIRQAILKLNCPKCYLLMNLRATLGEKNTNVY